ncbi:hypothetical protein FRB90_008921, partial [Tulasnella sp. 427]
MFRTAISRAASTALCRGPSLPARSIRFLASSSSHPSLPARNIARAIPIRFNSTASPPASTSTSTPTAQPETPPEQVKIEPRLSLTFTCTVPD